jgi:hypothetical protein
VTTDALPAGSGTLWFRAFRLGFEPSSEVSVPIESKEYSDNLA